MKRCTSLLIACSLTSFTAQAQQPATPTPQPEHEWLRKFVGEWTSTHRPPGASESTGGGSVSARMIGKFWVVIETNANMGGMSFTALQTIGYDAKTKKLTATWIDSVWNYRWIYTGELIKSENKMVFTAEGPSMAGDGGTAQYRDIYEFKSDDLIVSTAQMKNDAGEWVTFMTGEVRRKPTAKADKAPK